LVGWGKTQSVLPFAIYFGSGMLLFRRFNVMQVTQVGWCWFAAMPMGSACFRALPEIRP
jgi:hypothetical protein